VQFPDFDPYVPFLHYGAFGVRWYAIAYIVGIVLGWLYARTLIERENLWTPRDAPVTKLQLDDLILWVTLGVILGGRIGYILFYGLPGALAGRVEPQSNMLLHPLEMVKIWEGGMSFHGGALGVITAVIVFSMRNRIDPLRLGDLVAPCVPIGLFFGRIANFINGELWGRATTVPWGVVFCNKRIIAAQGGCSAGLLPRHPSQLYEASLEGVALFLLLYWAVHKARLLDRPGQITGVFLVGYGLARFSLEHVREPDAFMPVFLQGWLTMGMLLSLPMIAVGLWLIWRARRIPVAAPDGARVA
jgi:phosphatidylglycerol:prolipoprotein diacylglycerol transferase